MRPMIDAITKLPTSLSGVFVLEPRVFRDGRGFFFESYNQHTMADAGITEKFVQDNHPVRRATFCGACIIKYNAHRESWCAWRREKSWMSPSTCAVVRQLLGAGRGCDSPARINACCGCRSVSRTDSECSRKKRTSFTRRRIFTRLNTNVHSRGTILNSRSSGNLTANRSYR